MKRCPYCGLDDKGRGIMAARSSEPFQSRELLRVAYLVIGAVLVVALLGHLLS